ncbi:50S ribosomal protein L1 [Patescibacteria group bacterium]|nr:50S ribosomal protein L1 [Patescibacteria group bacterium]MBU1472518.1 50S ribosomal protein L1 [Patescibacteria group bacterium]MBU2460109.1 50S ribosomal protein L1 [Patescibacteria group bacterium]MBU2544678.1 50S ribosomal protein L1 [Patescibacteria group bacterium]
MGKIRVATLGSEEEKEQKRRADARRQTKKSKKSKVEGIGLKGGERVAVVEGGDIKTEYKQLIGEVEKGATKPAKGGSASGRKKVKIRIRSKRYKRVAGLVDKTKLYPLADAVALVKKTSLTRFDGAVELHVNLSPTALGEKNPPAGGVRGSVSLPHGTGRQVRVAIADEALISAVEKGVINFDILVAHPSLMPKLAKVARILGPKGLMPNPKTGTISEDPAKTAESLSHGKVNFKTEPDNPIVHMVVGKISFDDTKLIDNTSAVLDAIGRMKIASATIASTMGPGIKIMM